MRALVLAAVAALSGCSTPPSADTIALQIESACAEYTLLKPLTVLASPQSQAALTAIELGIDTFCSNPKLDAASLAWLASDVGKVAAIVKPPKAPAS
jgi:hypothetical protein